MGLMEKKCDGMSQEVSHWYWSEWLHTNELHLWTPVLFMDLFMIETYSITNFIFFFIKSQPQFWDHFKVRQHVIYVCYYYQESLESGSVTC